jgi:hypothetical protein
MTIKIERDSQLRVSDSHSDSSTSHVPPFETGMVEDDFLLVNFPQMCSGVGKLRSSTLDDDTASTGSFSSDSTDSGLRRVSFANNLVTDSWTRPYTPRSEVSSLFYSTEETTRYVALSTFSTRILVGNSEGPSPEWDSQFTHPNSSLFLTHVLLLFALQIPPRV